MSILDKIAAATRQRVQKYQDELSLNMLKGSIQSVGRQPQDFRSFFDVPGFHVIAEIKLASPSKGPIAPDLLPLDVATDYLSNGATALSVLTEPEFFKGDIVNLQKTRYAHPNAALLMKDFIIDPYQLYLGHAMGADACLLMASLLDEKQLEAMYQEAISIGLTPLVEVHDSAEMQRAKSLGARLIGINNRNLKTLEVDLSCGETLIQEAPSEATVICESGLTSGADLKRMHEAGFSGFLIGSHLMASGQPGQALRTLLLEADPKFDFGEAVHSSQETQDL